MSQERVYYDALKRIARQYQTADRLLKNGGQYGLEAIEELSMAYENMQSEAERAIKGKRRPY